MSSNQNLSKLQHSRSKLGSKASLSGRGVDKKRPGRPSSRVDRDGDVDMGDSATGLLKNRSGRSTPEHHSRGGPQRALSTANRSALKRALQDEAAQERFNLSPRTRQEGPNSRPRTRQRSLSPLADMDRVAIRGYLDSKIANSHDAGRASLSAWIERKATGNRESPQSAKIQKSFCEGDAFVIYLKQEDTSKVLRLNKFTFAGAVLSIEEVNKRSPRVQNGKSEPLRSETPKISTKAVLQSILDRRFDPASKLLDLAALGNDEAVIALKDENFFDLNGTSHSKLFQALMVVFDDAFPTIEKRDAAVESVSLASNAIPSVSTIISLSQQFPGLKNLDLSDNCIRDLKALSYWKNKFSKLELIYLQNNPIEKNDPAYGTTLQLWFPQLTTISNSAKINPKPVIPQGFGVPTTDKTLDQVDRERKAIDLSYLTGMTLQFSGECLNDNAWNLQAAYMKFEEVKDRLPAEAFTPST